jgi:hypothetical protein
VKLKNKRGLFPAHAACNIRETNDIKSLFLQQKPFMRLPLPHLLLFLAIAAGANAREQLFTGTIGKYKVAFNLDISESSVYGSYFYETSCIDIIFTGEANGNRFEMSAGPAYAEEKDREKLVLVRKGNRITGTWKFKGKTLPVSLTEKPKAQIANTYAAANKLFAGQEMSDYELYRTSFAKLERMDSVTTDKGVTFQWFREARSDVKIFRVIKGLPMEKIRFLNDYLEAYQLNGFSNYASCVNGEGMPAYESSILSWFINSDFFSIRIYHAYWCGASPSFGQTFHNFDLRGLKELTPDDLLPFPGQVIYDGNNWSQWYPYREEIYAGKLIGYLKALHPGHFPPVDDESSVTDDSEGNIPDIDVACRYSTPQPWAFADVLITESGLFIGAAVGGAAKVCDYPEWAVIPYVNMKNDLNPLYRDALLKIR